jgi:hypothetical protein
LQAYPFVTKSLKMQGLVGFIAGRVKNAALYFNAEHFLKLKSHFFGHARNKTGMHRNLREPLAFALPFAVYKKPHAAFVWPYSTPQRHKPLSIGGQCTMGTYIIQLKNSLKWYVVGLRRLAVIEIITVLIPGIRQYHQKRHPGT